MNRGTLENFIKTVVFLILMIAVQYNFNSSLYISESLIDAIIILATLYAGLWSGVILSLVEPISYCVVSGFSLFASTNFTLIPVIIIANLILVFSVFFTKKKTLSLIIGLICGSVMKWLVMWGSVEFIIKPLMQIEINAKLMAQISEMFKFVQLHAALSGSLIAFLCYISTKKYIKK